MNWKHWIVMVVAGAVARIERIRGLLSEQLTDCFDRIQAKLIPPFPYTTPCNPVSSTVVTLGEALTSVTREEVMVPVKFVDELRGVSDLIAARVEVVRFSPDGCV